MKKKLAVFSHERSGTHFLMNTVGLNSSYVSDPWWNFDMELGLNFYSSESIVAYFEQFDGKDSLEILKSHHSFDFFGDIISYLAERFYILYVYRDPRDTMISFHKHLSQYEWQVGPKTSKASELMRHEPSGAVMRYQMKQAQTMLHRWQDHVCGWVDYAEKNPKDVLLVRYEDLNIEFDYYTKQICQFIGEPIEQAKRPGEQSRVIGQGVNHGQCQINPYKAVFSDEDNDFCFKQIGKTMTRLGYHKSGAEIRIPEEA